MTNNVKLGIALAVVAVVAAFFVGHTFGTPNVSDAIGVGAPGTTLPIENYVPAILYNGGYYSTLGITTTGDVSAAAGTFTGAVALTSTFQLGSAGTALSELKSGTCTIFAYATTIAASSSAQVDCSGGAALTAISGIQSGDRIFASLASTTSSAGMGLNIEWVAASTTAGYITMMINNATGAVFTWASTASSSIPYLVVR